MSIGRGTLYLKTLELLRNRSRQLTFETIAAELDGLCDDKITAAWLGAFAVDRFTRPPVDKVQCLYEYLSGDKLLSD